MRQPDYPVHATILERWSPRAFAADAMPEADLMSILEAGRWAPSAYNAQPWRFVWALRGDLAWNALLGLLVPFNQTWADKAAALVFFLSDTMQEGRSGDLSPSHSHSFDTGAAWAMMALQAGHLGYHSHGMTGVDFAAAARELGASERYRVEAAAAFGLIGDPASLPEGLREREAPSGRKPLSEIAFHGRFDR